MDVEAFRNSPVGRLVPISGTDVRTSREYRHFAYLPDPLAGTPSLSESTWAAVARASYALGRLSQASKQVPNPALLRRPTLTREAQSTSALEGTYAPIEEVLASQADDDADQASLPSQVREILNYIRAAEYAFQNIADGRPINVGILEDLHQILVRGTKSETADAGRIRTVQVFIGSPGLAIQAARFIPPPPGLELQTAVRDLLDWINADLPDRNPVVAASLAHYQFETLHPFNDGNGRIGRLLVVVQLMIGTQGIIGEPLLSISPWFEARRASYLDHLAEVSKTGDWDSWVKFFAEGLAASAVDTAKRVDQLLDLQTQFRNKLRTARVKGVITDIAENLIGSPYLTVAIEAQRTGKTHQAIYNAIDKLLQLGILSQYGGRDYGKMYFAPSVLKILSAPPD